MKSQHKHYRQLTQGQDASLVTLVERKSLLTLIGKVEDKTAETVSNMMINMLSRVDTIHTITLDNGGEFAQHQKVTKATGSQIFLARPYASYQRGTNENTNGLIHRCWPKKMRKGALSKQDIRDMELRLNMTPRKVLLGLTPIEAYTGCRVALTLLIQPRQLKPRALRRQLNYIGKLLRAREITLLQQAVAPLLGGRPKRGLPGIGSGEGAPSSLHSLPSGSRWQDPLLPDPPASSG